MWPQKVNNATYWYEIGENEFDEHLVNNSGLNKRRKSKYFERDYQQKAAQSWSLGKKAIREAFVDR